MNSSIHNSHTCPECVELGGNLPRSRQYVDASNNIRWTCWIKIRLMKDVHKCTEFGRHPAVPARNVWDPRQDEQRDVVHVWDWGRWGGSTRIRRKLWGCREVWRCDGASHFAAAQSQSLFNTKLLWKYLTQDLLHEFEFVFDEWIRKSECPATRTVGVLIFSLRATVILGNTVYWENRDDK